MLSRIKILCLTTAFTSLVLATAPTYADGANIVNDDSAIKKLQSGFGEDMVEQMLKAPSDQSVTIATNIAQGAYLLPPSALPVGSLTRNLLKKITSGINSGENAQYSLIWQPTKPSMNPLLLTSPPLDAVNINNLLEPMVYDKTQDAQAQSVIDALSSRLTPLQTLNFDDLVHNLSGNKQSNINMKLSERDVQNYLATLRNYLAVQTIALGNLSQLYQERQEINTDKLPDDTKRAVNAIKQKIKGPVSALKLENFMATRRILNNDWYNNLVKENPATLQREQTQLLAESLAQGYQTRMTLERLLATMSVLVLELNSQTRGQLQGQIQNISNPSQP